MGKAIVITGVNFSSKKLTTIVLNKTVISISAVYTQTHIVRPNTPLNNLRQDLVVTATFDDNTSAVVTNYTLSGTLAVGTSTIQVSYKTVSTTFNVIVVDSQNSYSLSDNTLIKVAASCVWSAANQYSEVGYSGLIPSDGTKRRAYVIDEGDSIPLYELSTGSSMPIVGVYIPNSYLIPIPNNATHVDVAILPSTQYVGLGIFTYNPTTHEFIRAVDKGWSQGSQYADFNAGQYQYISLTSKYNSAGSSYPEEPTDLIVTFSH